VLEAPSAPITHLVRSRRPSARVRSTPPASWARSVTPAQHLLSPPLRNDQRPDPRCVRRRLGAGVHVDVADAAVELVVAKRHPEPAQREQPVGDPEGVEHLQRPGLQTFTTRPREGLRRRVQQPNGPPPASQFACCCQSRRARFDHRNICYVCTHARQNRRSETKSQ
jgi:hypothetical protein